MQRYTKKTTYQVKTIAIAPIKKHQSLKNILYEKNCVSLQSISQGNQRSVISSSCEWEPRNLPLTSARGYNGSRVLAWAVFTSTDKVIPRTSIRRSGIRCHASIMFIYLLKHERILELKCQQYKTA